MSRVQKDHSLIRGNRNKSITDEEQRTMVKPPGIFVLAAALVLFSGCLGSPAVRDSTAGTLHTHYDYADDFSPVLGCYESVTGNIFNSGNVSAFDVQLHFNLVDTRTNTIRDSRSVFISIIGPGESRTFETTLDGRCTQDYRVEFAFGK
jgi:hypothetical protein